MCRITISSTKQCFVNPYTGRILGVIDVHYEFFNVTKQLHRQLLLIKPFGRVIVGVCILMFLLKMVTGFVLWLPKSYKRFKQNTSDNAALSENA